MYLMYQVRDTALSVVTQLTSHVGLYFFRDKSWRGACEICSNVEKRTECVLNDFEVNMI